MVRLFLAAIGLNLTVFCAITLPAQAQDNAVIEQRAEDVVAVLNGDTAYGDVFSERFIASIPEAQFQQIKTQLTSQMGALIGLEGIEPIGNPGAAVISLRFESAIASGPMQLETAEPFKIAGLRLNSFAPVDESGLALVEQFEALPGTTNLLMARLDGSETAFEYNADRPLAIGSTFKLYVLSAMSRSIALGERNWDDVVPLTEHSFPSGQLQDWPQGSPITLHTLATMMISISDNTATDQLMAVLGRDAVEAELRASGHSDPAATLPFMTTREMFLLKLGEEQALTQYVEMDAAQRRAQLDGLQDRDLDMDDIINVFGGGPHFLEVEWFASARDIARIYDQLKNDKVALEILGINLATDRSHFEGWEYVGYKGGSEPGVLNFSWLLRNSAGEYWVLTMSWNNPDEVVSEIALLGLAQTILAQARDQPSAN